MAAVIGSVVRLVGSGIGLGREAYLYNKEKKALKSSAAGPSSSGLQSPREEDIYVQLPTDDANELIARGEAVVVTDEELRKVDVKMSELDVDSEYDFSSEEDDEQDWANDEAVNPPAYEEVPAYGHVVKPDVKRSVSVGTLVSQVVPEYSPSAEMVNTTRLPYPVIIPQRRPGTKGRGFVNAYAPVLEASGIDQTTFLTFLDNFHTASQASPVFDALVVAANIAGMVPSVIAMAVNISIQVAAGTAKEIQTRHRTNTYLDAINKELFMPKGLYAMIVIYRSDDNSRSQRLRKGASNGYDDDDVEIGVESYDMMTMKAIARYAPNSSSSTSPTNTSAFKARMKTLRTASGTSNGETGMPTTCAPLIFPFSNNAPNPSQLSPTISPTISRTPSSQDVDASSSSSSSSTAAQKQPNKFKRAGAFIADYADRRAQANYIAKDPDSVLASNTPVPVFRSRYADPNSKASNGHLVNFVTGGAVNLESIQQRKQRRREERRAEEMRGGGRRGRGESRRKGPVGLVLSPVKKVLKKDVMYLVVVNMPSESEMREAREAAGLVA